MEPVSNLEGVCTPTTTAPTDVGASVADLPVGRRVAASSSVSAAASVAALVAGLLAGRGQPAGADDSPPYCFLYLEQPDVYCASGAAQPGAPDGAAAAIFVCGEPRGCDSNRACRAARNYARPARSAGRRRVRIQAEAAAERRRSAAPEGAAGDGRGCGAGEPGVGARNAAAGAAFGSAVDYCEPPRFPRWSGDGATAESGDPAAGIVCADSRSWAGWAAESGAMGAGAGLAGSEGAGLGDCAGGAGGRRRGFVRLCISTKSDIRRGFRCGKRWLENA